MELIIYIFSTFLEKAEKHIYLFKWKKSANAPRASFPTLKDEITPREAGRKVESIMDKAKSMMDEANELYSEGIRQYTAKGVGIEIILKCSLQAMMSIGNSLLEIRDELRKMNERSEHDGDT